MSMMTEFKASAIKVDTVGIALDALIGTTFGKIFFPFF